LISLIAVRGWILAIAVALSSYTQLPEIREPITEDTRDIFDGYHNQEGRWIPGYINNETWYTAAPQHTSGRAVFYGPGVMKATAEWRGMSLRGYLGGVAMMSPSDIGEVVWIKRIRWEGPYLVVDCARRGDMFGATVHRKEVVEVDFLTAKRWGMVTGGVGTWEAINWWVDVEVYKVTTWTH